MSLQTRKIRTGIIGIDIEGVRGEYTEPNTYFGLMDAAPMDVAPEIIEWQPMRNTMTTKDYLVSNIKASLPIKLAMPLSFSSATIGNAWLAGMTPIFKGAGLQVTDETTYASVKPDDNAQTTVSAFINIGGLESRMAGATLELKWSYNTKEIAVFEGTLTGNYVKNFENAAPASPTFIEVDPVICKNVYAVTLAGTNTFGDENKGACCAKFEVDLGNELNPYDCMQAETGEKFQEITNRKVMANLTIGSWSGDDDDLDSDFRDGVAQTLTLTPVQSTASNPVIMIVNGKITNKGTEDVNGFGYHAIEVSGAGDAESEFELRFYGLTADVTAPSFSVQPSAVYSPISGASGVSGATSVTVSGENGSSGVAFFGTVANYESIHINGELCDTVTAGATDGFKDYTHSLVHAELGKFTITILATDSAGNTATKEIEYTVTA